MPESLIGKGDECDECGSAEDVKQTKFDWQWGEIDGILQEMFEERWLCDSCRDEFGEEPIDDESD